jgi:hypothetical protein
MSKHPHCFVPGCKVSWLPNRVIQVGLDDGSLSLKLWETEGNAGRYITLTHRWNELTQDSSTTTFNIEARKDRIELTELSATFQDAIVATRRLGIQYLWIDTLCIIQNSQKDWENESENMMAIYESSWLNIAAAGSENSSGRLFMERDLRLTGLCRLPNLSGIPLPYSTDIDESIYAYMDPQVCALLLFDGFLTQRGWILQERVLSPRTVYFSRDEVFWECGTHIASESAPWGFDKNGKSLLVKFKSVNGPPDLYRGPDYSAGDPKPRSQAYRLNDSFTFVLPYNEMAPVYDYWYRLIENYSSMSLTKATDRLLAVKGLAQALHKSRMPKMTFAQSYFNGIWIEDLARSLLWYAELPSHVSKSTTSNKMPSYSWASCKGPVKYSRLLTSSTRFESSKTPPDPGKEITDYRKLGCYYSSVQVSDMESKSIDGLCIQGELTRARLWIGNDPFDFLNATARQVSQCNNSIGNWGIQKQKADGVPLDIMLDNSQIDEGLLKWLDWSDRAVWCLKLLTDRSYNEKPALPSFDCSPYGDRRPWTVTENHYGLLLAPLTNDGLLLRRIGIYKIRIKVNGYDSPKVVKVILR